MCCVKRISEIFCNHFRNSLKCFANSRNEEKIKALIEHNRCIAVGIKIDDKNISTLSRVSSRSQGQINLKITLLIEQGLFEWRSMDSSGSIIISNKRNLKEGKGTNQEQVQIRKESAEAATGSIL